MSQTATLGGTRPMHLKSTSRDLRVIFENRIHVRHIAVFDLRTCGPNEDAELAKIRMSAGEFDWFPVKTKHTVTGYVERTNLGPGRCRDYRKTFVESDFIRIEAPVIALVQRLRELPRVFVTEGGTVVGIATRGDLQKAPVRMLLFGLVTLLEMQMLRLVKEHYPNDSWKSSIRPGRLRYAREVQAERIKRNEAIDLVDCLQFGDKRDLLLRSPIACEHLGITSKTRTRDTLREAEKLRDKLAHGQDLVSGATWLDIISTMNEIESFLMKCELTGTEPYGPNDRSSSFGTAR